TGDYRSDKVGAKIREASLEKIPYMLVVGDKEVSASTVAVRHRTDGDLGTMPVADLLVKLTEEINARRLVRTPG
ncbi:threonine--tRNA ligase, partial [bacterium]|nr:threonine--tRNA ligase [bacterium]